ncbi:MAG: ABC transporter permease [Kiritimatiellae bacterium]|nr:ABC transporter permease [Kiritimatiellia bacterium]
MRGRLGRAVLLNCRNAGRALLILLEAMTSLRFVLSKRSRPVVLQQLYVTGIKSLGVISVVAMFTGMILALQMGLELRKYGQEVNIGLAVMVSMLREMGPFMTALILAASVGSAMAAELGTMTVSEEIAALEVMSISPVRFLVMPRLAAMMIMTPLLTFYACMLGVVGGAIVGATQLGVSVPAYLDNATRWAENKDLYVGLLKSFVFGIMITTICCYQGFATTEGAVGVGRATRRSVVVSFLSILVVGYIITRLFYQ